MIDLEFLDPDGLFPNFAPITKDAVLEQSETTNSWQTFGFTVTLDNLLIVKEGTYKMVATIDKQIVSESPFTINVVPEEQWPKS